MKNICFRCGYPKDMHENGGKVVVAGVRKCHKYMKFKKSYAFLRLLTCPFHIHIPRIMVLVERGEKHDLYQCPRCKTKKMMDIVSEMGMGK